MYAIFATFMAFSQPQSTEIEVVNIKELPAVNLERGAGILPPKKKNER
ncbi:hypothetical protein [Pseudoalteromonas lipolytica]|uniref:Uncharacterized protein n=1 Tax=Pseudoalteromonas lipolytica TaxID=570156 RepID=A0ABU8SY85_9GAMM